MVVGVPEIVPVVVSKFNPEGNGAERVYPVTAIFLILSPYHSETYRYLLFLSNNKLAGALKVA